jgi:hypothetical protein
MPLSEHEQQMLDQIERALYEEDPKFASHVRGARFRGGSRRRRRIEGIGVFVVGIALLVTGMLIPFRVLNVPVVSVVGFLLMFFGALLTVTQLRKHGGEPSAGKDAPGKPGKTRSNFAQRMEERFRKRFDQGG